MTAVSGTTLNAEANLTFDGDTLTAHMSSATPAIIVGDSNRTGAGQHLAEFRGYWDGNHVARIVYAAGDDTTNKDDGVITMHTTPSGGSSTERLRITSAGLVGIGSDNPDTKLTVCVSSGDAYIRTIGGTNQGLLISNGAGTLIGGFASGGAIGGSANDIAVRVESGNNIVFAHGSTERMRITSGGDVRLNGGALVGDDTASVSYTHLRAHET